MDQQIMDILKTIAEDIVIFGGAAMALFVGVKRIYTTARNVEKLVDKSDSTDQKNMEYRQQIKDDLQNSHKLEEERHVLQDKKIDGVTNHIHELAEHLRAHIMQEEERDLIRDKQLIRLTDHIDEIVAEMRPNGGSSMKDILTKTSSAVSEINTRVAVIEEWKSMNKPSPPKRKILRKKKK
jgi:hypothetical protein